MTEKATLKKMGIQKEVENYIEVLIRNNIKPQKVILFGSFAKKKPRKYSDIDLAVVSNQFEEDPVEATMKLLKLSDKVSDRIEPIALTPQDMESRYQTLIGEIKKYGRVVYSS